MTFACAHPLRYVAALACAPAVAIGGQGADVSYSMLTDAVRPVAGGTVSFTWSGGSALITSDDQGNTNTVRLPDEVEIEVTALETETPSGSTIGQTFDYAFVLDTAFDDTAIQTEFFQPETRTAIFSSSDVIHYDTESNFWYATHSVNANYSFSCDVGTLTGPREAEFFARYVDLPSDGEHRQGIVLRLHAPVSLDYQDGFLIELPLTTGFAGEEVVHSTQASAGFSYRLARVRDGSAFVHVWGNLPVGDSVLLLRNEPAQPSGPRHAISHVAPAVPPLGQATTYDCVACQTEPLGDCQMTGIWRGIPKPESYDCFMSPLNTPMIDAWFTRGVPCSSSTSGTSGKVFRRLRRGQTTFEYEVEPNTKLHGTFFNDSSAHSATIPACVCISLYRCNVKATREWNCRRTVYGLEPASEWGVDVFVAHSEDYVVISGIGGGYNVLGTSCIMDCCN